MFVGFGCAFRVLRWFITSGFAVWSYRLCLGLIFICRWGIRYGCEFGFVYV